MQRTALLPVNRRRISRDLQSVIERCFCDLRRQRFFTLLLGSSSRPVLKPDDHSGVVKSKPVLKFDFLPGGCMRLIDFVKDALSGGGGILGLGDRPSDDKH
jgi:hypothetical protein